MKLDWKAVFLATWLPALIWGIACLGATLSGYPGVICVTPLGWLLALPVGTRLSAYSTSQRRGDRLLEAAAGGGLLGLLQGALFGASYALALPPEPGEVTRLVERMLQAGLGFTVAGGAGLVVCAATAAGMCFLADRRRGQLYGSPRV